MYYNNLKYMVVKRGHMLSDILKVCKVKVKDTQFSVKNVIFDFVLFVAVDKHNTKNLKMLQAKATLKWFSHMLWTYWAILLLLSRNYCHLPKEDMSVFLSLGLDFFSWNNWECSCLFYPCSKKGYFFGEFPQHKWKMSEKCGNSHIFFTRVVKRDVILFWEFPQQKWVHSLGIPCLL